tara:strand:+ start:627 stop:1178 length:552 start_codon:yes stop_codon:yes gene_type:complete
MKNKRPGDGIKNATRAQQNYDDGYQDGLNDSKDTAEYAGTVQVRKSYKCKWCDKGKHASKWKVEDCKATAIYQKERDQRHQDAADNEYKRKVFVAYCCLTRQSAYHIERQTGIKESRHTELTRKVLTTLSEQMTEEHSDICGAVQWGGQWYGWSSNNLSTSRYYPNQLWWAAQLKKRYPSAFL